MKFLIKLLVLIAVPSAAFLTFIAQPVIGKILTPRYGGSAGTWMTTSLFFQTALLLGYASAFWFLRKSRRSFMLVIALALLAPLLTRIPPINFASWPEVPAILLGLVLSLGPALILTTSIGILIQGWVASDEGEVPYYLYGISNIGSALALLAYPFWIEPRVPLSTQILVLKILLVALGLTAAALAWLYSKTNVAPSPSAPAPADDAGSGEEVIPFRRIAGWALLSFATCTIMLGAIRLLSGELGSNPFAWVLPLSMYLLSFTLTFTRLWPAWMTTLGLIPFTGALFGYATTKGFADIALSPWPLTWLLCVVGSACICGHALLYRLRPAKRFPLFYLVMAGGGAAAGLCATAIFPAVLNRSYEFLATAFLLWLAISVHEFAGKKTFPRFALAGCLALPPGWMICERARTEHIAGTRITHLRNYYGTMTVADGAFLTTVSSDTTLHGVQFKGSASGIPTSYYTRGSGLGIVLDGLQQNSDPLRIGVIGLGAGTLAAYPRAQDEIVFWEINPLSEKIARERFTFLEDCAGRCEVRLEDGRIGIRKSSSPFNVLVIDAFSGDSIPAHLLTEEAIREYMARLDRGFLIVHISNRYFDLMPVLADAAARAGWLSISVSADPGPSASDNAHAASTEYAILYPPTRQQNLEPWISAAMQSEKIKYTVTPGDQIEPVRWTDERHAIVDVLLE